MKKCKWLLASMLVSLCLSACQNATELPESQAVVLQPEQPVEEEVPPAVQKLDLSVYHLEYGQQEEFLKLYEQIQPVPDAEKYEGTWHRTDVASSVGAEITITDQTEDGFSFTGDFYYYSHSGWMEGDAKFAAPNVAVYENINDWGGDDTTPEYLVFEKTQEGMNVYASAASADLGFGMNVFADGSYVQGEPVYTNATVLADNFTAEVQEKMQVLLGNDYDDYFKFPVEMGSITSTPATLEDGTKAMFYDVFVPTMGGYAFQLLICENGEVYFYSEASEIGLKTTDEGASDFPAYTLEE